MGSIKQWFQDWSDACEYARECAPDFSSLTPLVTPHEPYTALVAIGAVCALLWWWNERGLRAAREKLLAAQAAGMAALVVAAQRPLADAAEDEQTLPSVRQAA